MLIKSKSPRVAPAAEIGISTSASFLRLAVFFPLYVKLELSDLQHAITNKHRNMAAPSSAPVANGTFPADDAAGQTVAAMAGADKISADEIALYDRQIRLWGVQAQEK